MTCEELEELAGALALDAALPEEVAAAREHLRTCTRPHELVRELMATAALLALAAEPADPPARLRERILTAARAEGRGADTSAPAQDAGVELRPRSLRPRPAPPPPTPPSPPPPPPVVLPLRQERVRFFSSRALPGWLAAAAMLVVAAGLGVWNIQLRHDLDTREAALTEQRNALWAMARAREGTIVALGPSPEYREAHSIALVGSKGGTTVLFTRLRRPEGGKVYQLWAIRGGVAVDLGPSSVFVPNEEGWAMVDLPELTLQKGERLAVTVEPQRVPQPTGPIVLEGELLSALPRLLSQLQ